MNKRYGDMFGEYNPYLSEEDRKRMAVHAEGPIMKSLIRLDEKLFPNTGKSQTNDNEEP